jgi:arginyl-tRNA synthetase
MTKELLVMECININGWYNKIRADKNKLNGLSVSTLWALRKNMKKIAETVDSFNELKASLENELQEEFFNEEKSEEVIVKGENGEDTPARKVKDEYFDDYQKKIDELNGKLNELAITKESYDFTSINMDKEIERLNTDCNLDMDDLDMLSIFE